MWGSNSWPSRYQHDALPTELMDHMSMTSSDIESHFFLPACPRKKTLSWAKYSRLISQMAEERSLAETVWRQKFNGPCEARTHDLRVISMTLYRLSQWTSCVYTRRILRIDRKKSHSHLFIIIVLDLPASLCKMRVGVMSSAFEVSAILSSKVLSSVHRTASSLGSPRITTLRN